MVDTSLYATFLVTAFALRVSPGPGMMSIVAMGGRGGPTAGVMAACGVACATLVHPVAAALGPSALFAALPALYHVPRRAGAGYLSHLAVKAFRDRSAPGAEGAPGGPVLRRAFRQGAVTNLLNPKVILFDIALLPQFVDPELGHVPEQLLLLGPTIVTMGFVVDGPVGPLSGKLSALLRRSRRVARGLDVFSGTVFTAPAVRPAASPR
ncbi:LysE family translocator [Streptomyces sp. NPDC001443]